MKKQVQVGVECLMKSIPARHLSSLAQVDAFHQNNHKKSAGKERATPLIGINGINQTNMLTS